MVEMALVLPVLLLIVWGAMDFGRMLFTANSLATAVREGARFAAVQNAPFTAGAQANIRARVRSSFSRAMGGPALTDAQILIYDSTAAAPHNVTVKINNYAWPTLTPLGSVIGRTVSLTREAKFRWERAGQAY